MWHPSLPVARGHLGAPLYLPDRHLVPGRGPSLPAHSGVPLRDQARADDPAEHRLSGAVLQGALLGTRFSAGLGLDREDAQEGPGGEGTTRGHKETRMESTWVGG